MNNNFKKGLFLHIVSHNQGQWEKDIANLSKFKDLDFVELWIEEVDLSKKQINFLIKKLDNYKLIVHAPFINLSLISSHSEINKASIEIIKKTIDLSQELKAELVTIHAGAYPLFLQEKEVRDIFINNFKKIIKYAQGKVAVSLENISMKKTTQISYPVMLKELKEINSKIKNINFTIDIGHCIQNKDSFYDFLKNNKDKIKNIHLHNACYHGKAHYGFNKKGDLDLKEFIKFLKKINYQEYLSLEVLGEDDIKKSWNKLLNNIKS